MVKWSARPPQELDARLADEAVAAAAGVDLKGLRSATVLSYDTARYPLCVPAHARKRRRTTLTDATMCACACLHSREHIKSCLGLSAADDLAALSVPADERRKRGGGYRGPSTYWIQRWHAARLEQRAWLEAFDRLYLRFVREVVVPHIGDPHGILCQRRPTFRCHVAGGGEAIGRPHRDAEYGHPCVELNFWLPLTSCTESNSLCGSLRARRASASACPLA